MVKVPFEYQSRNSLPLKLLAIIFLAPIFACGIILFFFLPLAMAAEKWFRTEITSQHVWLVFGALVCYPLIGSIISNIRYLKIDCEKITWTKFGRKEIIILRSDIQKVTWQQRKVIFETAVNKHSLNLASLPIKSRIEISSILGEWAPGNTVNFEVLQFQQWKRDLSDPVNLTEQSAETNRKKGAALRWIGSIPVILAFGAMSWSFFIEPIENIIFVIIFLGGMITVPLVILFAATRYRRIQVNNDGVMYLNGRKEILFPWDKIETIALRTQNQNILIWTGKRYKSLSYAGMNLEAINEVFNIIYYKAMAKDIAVGIV